MVPELVEVPMSDEKAVRIEFLAAFLLGKIK
jgi:hypothetical protein